jgi:hypothetical protein
MRNGFSSTGLLLAITGFKLLSMNFLSCLEEEYGEFAIRRAIFVVFELTFSLGFFLDVIECLIQRNFGYNTTDVRVAYVNIKEALLDPSITKVVIIAHSQGGIILSIALDNLLADLPRECNIFMSGRC